MSKYFYIDENGNKKKYIGNVKTNIDGSIVGTLTKTTYTDKIVELKYVKTGDDIIDSKTLYFYINKEGEKIYVNQTDNNVKNKNGELKIEISNKNILNLVYHNQIDKSVYYTYFDKSTNKNEVFDGEILYNADNNSYYGYK
jgi:hypothetical protein